MKNIKELSLGNHVGIKHDSQNTVYKVACLMFNHVQVESKAGDTKSVQIGSICPILLTEEWMSKILERELNHMDKVLIQLNKYVHIFQNNETLCNYED